MEELNEKTYTYRELLRKNPDLIAEFSDRMDAWLGAGSCRRYRISDRGAYAEWE